MAALSGKVGKVKITSATATTSAGQAFTSISPTTLRTDFRVSTAARRHWTRATPPTIFVNSTLHTDYSVNYVQGKVTFGTPLTTAQSAQVTGTIRWVTASYLPFTRTWTLDQTVDMLDVTTLSTTTGNAKWRSFTPGLSQATVTLGRVINGGTTDTPAFFDRLTADQDLIVDLVAQPAGGTTFHWEAYARVASDGFTTPIDALLAETATLQIDGPMFYATTE
jgi:hypothetical protein